MATISIGKYNKRLTIEQPIQTQDAAGAPVITWQPLGDGAWARIEPLKATEATVAHQVLPVMDTRITLRYHPLLAGMNEKWRCAYNGIVYNIVSVAHTELGNREIVLSCTSGSNRG